MLLPFFTENLEEIKSIPLVRKLMRIYVLLFCLGSPRIFTKLLKLYFNNLLYFASHKYKNDYLFGRHASNGSLHREDKYVSRHSNLLVTTSGFCDELEKVSFDTSAGDRIFGAKNWVSQPRNISHRREKSESKNNMSKCTDWTGKFDFIIKKN